MDICMPENQNISFLEHDLNGRRLIIFGASQSARKTIEICEERGYDISFIVDNNPAKWETHLNGYIIKDPNLLAEYGDEVIVLVASVYLLEIFSQLTKMGITHIYSAHLCNMIKSRQLAPVDDDDLREVERLKELVCDERSRDTVDKIIELRNHGINRLYEVFSGRQYFQKDIFDFSDEVFIDCGCFKGEEIDYLYGLGCGVKKVYAFEPDGKNYVFINDKYRDNADVVCYEKGVWSHSKMLCFNETGTDGSMICESGNKCIEAVAIDDAVRDDVTFIKMDVEGAELEALNGAVETIKRCRPKLAICIYHNDKDLWEIPFKIKSILSEYEIYIRQHSLGLSDTVLYAVCRDK